nr:helix-turn-helix domain-containing protein [Streptomyces mirabilis]
MHSSGRSNCAVILRRTLWGEPGRGETGTDRATHEPGTRSYAGNMTATGDANALGRYLRARRELVPPDEAWDQGNRRVPGLRREEVAFLAGISSDYYNRAATGTPRSRSCAASPAPCGWTRRRRRTCWRSPHTRARGASGPAGRSRSVTACGRSSTPGH